MSGVESGSGGSFASKLQFFKQLEAKETDKTGGHEGPEAPKQGVKNDHATIGGIRHTAQKNPPPRQGGIREKQFPARQIIEGAPSQSTQTLGERVRPMPSLPQPPSTETEAPVVPSQEHLAATNLPPLPEPPRGSKEPELKEGIAPEETVPHPDVESEQGQVESEEDLGPLPKTPIEAAIEHCDDQLQKLQSDVKEICKELRAAGLHEDAANLEKVADSLGNSSEKFAGGQYMRARRALMNAQNVMHKEVIHSSTTSPELQGKLRGLDRQFKQIRQEMRSVDPNYKNPEAKSSKPPKVESGAPPTGEAKARKLERQPNFRVEGLSYKSNPQAFVQAISTVAHQTILPLAVSSSSEEKTVVDDKGKGEAGAVEQKEHEEEEKGAPQSGLQQGVAQARGSFDQVLGRIENKDETNRADMRKLSPEQKQLAVRSEILSAKFRDLKMIENVHDLMTAKPPKLDAQGMAAAKAFLQEKGAWSGGKYQPMALKFVPEGGRFQLVPRKSMKKDEIASSIDEAFSLVAETSKKAPALKVQIFDVGRKEIPAQLLRATNLGDDGYKEPQLKWSNPSTIASGLSRSEVFKEFKTDAHEDLANQAAENDRTSRFAGFEGPAALSIINNPNNDRVIQFLQGHIDTHGEDHIMRDHLLPLSAERKASFEGTIQSGLGEFQKEIGQRNDKAFKDFVQVMGDASREQYADLMKGGLEALASTLPKDDPARAEIMKMRGEINTIAKSGSWQRLSEAWDAFSSLVVSSLPPAQGPAIEQ